MSGTSKGASKFAKQKLAEDPEYFKKLAAKRKKPVGGKHSPGSFKKGNAFASIGGRAGKRGKAKKITEVSNEDVLGVPNGPVHYIELPVKKPGVS